MKPEFTIPEKILADASSVEVFQDRLDEVLSSLVSWKLSLLMAGGWKIFDVSVILCQQGRKNRCNVQLLQGHILTKTVTWAASRNHWFNKRGKEPEAALWNRL